MPLNTVRIARLSCLGKNSVKESGVKYDRELKYQQKKKQQQELKVRTRNCYTLTTVDTN